MMSLDHRDILSRASASLQALVSFIDDPDDINARGTACILNRIAQDLDQIEAEAKAAMAESITDASS